MTNTTTRTCDVVIVGLGPTGTVLANLLGQSGWNVVGIERDVDLYYAPRAVHFDDEIMRIFQSAGLAKDIGRTSEPFTDMAFLLKAGAKPVMTTKIGSQDRRYGHPGAWWFHQPTLEALLNQGLRRYPNVTALRGYRATAIDQDARGVRVEVERLESQEKQTIQGRFVIGCDGGRSFVRKELNFILESADFDESWVVVDTKTRSGVKEPSLPKVHSQICDPAQPVTYVPMAGPYYEWQFMVVGDKDEREATDLAYVRKQLSAYADLETLEIIRVAYYKFHGLWAKQWRKGKVLLAGDSAHQMPPFLGQGMCAGVRDAHALSWRLDLILSGHADEALLDDYVTERSAHVQAIINGAMLLGNLIQTRSRFKAVLRNIFLFRLGNLIPPYKRFLYRLANRKKPISYGFLGGNHPLTGHLSIQPPITSESGVKQLLDESLGRGFALLTRRDANVLDHPGLRRLLQQIPMRCVQFSLEKRGDCIYDHTGALTRWFDSNNIDFVLIRPDRYVFDAGKRDDLDVLSKNLCSAYRSANKPKQVILGAAA